MILKRFAAGFAALLLAFSASAAELSAWSTSAASNNSASPNGWPEGMNFSGVNDSGREMMAVMARWQKDNNGSLTAGGGTTAYTLTPNGTYAAYASGLTFTFKMPSTNAASPTLNVSALGAKSIVGRDGVAITAGAMPSGAVVSVQYDGTNFQLQPALIASDVLAKLITVDGAASTLDADLLDGISSGSFLQTANLLTAITAVDGAASGIDADLLDGQSSAYFTTITNQTGTLAVANGGTGVTSSTGTGSVVLSASPTFTGTVSAAAISASTTIAATGNISSSTNIAATGYVQGAELYRGGTDITTYIRSVTGDTSNAGALELATTAETKTGTDAARAVTPAGLAGSSSLATSGYFTFPGGFTIQWGDGGTVAGSTTKAITFPTAFTTCYSVTANGNVDGSTQGADGYYISAMSATGFTFGNGMNTTQTAIHWIAVGII